MIMRQLLNEWLDDLRTRQLKPRTLVRYADIVRLHIMPPLGNADITTIKRRDINTYLSGIQSSHHLSAGSITLLITVLRLAFEYACDMEYIEWNPCRHIRRMTTSAPKQVLAFTREEQRKLENLIEKRGEKRLVGILICLYAGLRIGELLGLEWEDLGKNCRFLSINRTIYRCRSNDGSCQLYVDAPKTAASERIIPLPLHLSELLRTYRREATASYIICNDNGERMSTRSYQYIFARLTAEAGIRSLNFHALRHTFATRALERGMDIKTLSEIMGHKSASVTLNRYAHSMMETKVRMMNKMTRLV